MSTTKETTTTEKPPEPTAADVATVAGKLVGILQALPPGMQIRALGATATLLGIDKEQRRSTSQSQQRGNTNGSNQNRNNSR